MAENIGKERAEGKNAKAMMKKSKEGKVPGSAVIFLYDF